jgi:hypothetical protein
MIRFFIDPSAAKEAVLAGKGLLVEVNSPQHYRVTVVSRAGDAQDKPGSRKADAR